MHTWLCGGGFQTFGIRDLEATGRRRRSLHNYYSHYTSVKDLWASCERMDAATLEAANIGVDMDLPTHDGSNTGLLGSFIRGLHKVVKLSPRYDVALTTEAAMWVRFLDQHRLNLANAAAEQTKVSTGRFGNKEYRTIQLVRALLMSDLLRDKAHLRHLLKLN